MRRSSAETELPAQVASFLGLPHRSSHTCAEKATISVRFSPSATRLRRAAVARTLNISVVRPSPGPTQARDPPSLGPEAPCLPHHLAPRPTPAASKCAACRPPQTERRFQLRPLHHSNLAPAAGRTYLRRAAAAEAATAAPPSPSPSQCEPGPRQEDDGSDSGCRRPGVMLTRAAPSRPGRGGRRGHCGRGASERDTRALSAVWAGLRSRD